MAHFSDPKINLGLEPLVDMALGPRFLNEPGAAYSSEITHTIHAAAASGYDVHPLGTPGRTPRSVTWLEDRLEDIIDDQHPSHGYRRAQAEDAAGQIIARANTAAQIAALPSTMRWIGGLAAAGLVEGGLWSDEAIAAIKPEADGTRRLEHRTAGDFGYTARMIVRDLTPDDLAEENKRSLDPALLVRTTRFGAVAAQFATRHDLICFRTEPSAPGTINLILEDDVAELSPATFTYRGNSVPPYSEQSVGQHEFRGRHLNRIRQTAQGMTGRHWNAVYGVIGTMIDNRYTVPAPFRASDQGATRTGGWWRRSGR